MTLAPLVPIPPGHGPDALPWDTRQAARWRAAGLPAWSAPRLVAWVLAVATAVAIGLLATADTGPVCTEADPCGSTWGGFAMAVLMLVVPYWCLRLPDAGAGKPLSVLRCTWVPRESLSLAGPPDSRPGVWDGTGQPASSGVLYGPVHEGADSPCSPVCPAAAH
ncbi:hypothetical protein [Streptomyces sp. NPDC051219]|uniref:hypothetical protein n=1 Tax=Streptomyces sp. NPDC051219 TaxID=3155283 RepID=UPI0034451E3A